MERLDRTRQATAEVWASEGPRNLCQPQPISQATRRRLALVERTIGECHSTAAILNRLVTHSSEGKDALGVPLLFEELQACLEEVEMRHEAVGVMDLGAVDGGHSQGERRHAVGNAPEDLVGVGDCRRGSWHRSLVARHWAVLRERSTMGAFPRGIRGVEDGVEVVASLRGAPLATPGRTRPANGLARTVRG